VSDGKKKGEEGREFLTLLSPSFKIRNTENIKTTKPDLSFKPFFLSFFSLFQLCMYYVRKPGRKIADNGNGNENENETSTYSHPSTPNSYFMPVSSRNINLCPYPIRLLLELPVVQLQLGIIIIIWISESHDGTAVAVRRRIIISIASLLEMLVSQHNDAYIILS
jgi:hypothetical protein